jgi:hypothetical protein
VGSVCSSRSTDSNWRISRIAERAPAAIRANSAFDSSSAFFSRYEAEVACMWITDMLCATTSCSSRAIRVRSSATARWLCSTAMSRRASASCRRMPDQCRITIAAISTSTESVA